MMCVSCVASLYLSTMKNQLYYQAIDTIIVSGVIAVASIIDIPKTDEYFMSSSFLTNRVHVLDKTNVMDQVDDIGGGKSEQYETGYGKGKRSNYILQTGGYFDISADKIKLGD